MSQTLHQNIDVLNQATNTGTYLPLGSIVAILIYRSRRNNRRLQTPTSFGADSRIAGNIRFRRWLRSYFLNVFGNGDGRGQENGRKLER
jgi:hypothetical protein